jgi:hypothetical protein
MRACSSEAVQDGRHDPRVGTDVTAVARAQAIAAYRISRSASVLEVSVRQIVSTTGHDFARPTAEVTYFAFRPGDTALDVVAGRAAILVEKEKITLSCSDVRRDKWVCVPASRVDVQSISL